MNTLENVTGLISTRDGGGLRRSSPSQSSPGSPGQPTLLTGSLCGESIGWCQQRWQHLLPSGSHKSFPLLEKQARVDTTKGCRGLCKVTRAFSHAFLSANIKDKPRKAGRFEDKPFWTDKIKSSSIRKQECVFVLLSYNYRTA